MNTYKVIGKRALAQIVKGKEEETKSGILLAGESRKDVNSTLFARVISSNLVDVHIGDIVVFDELFGTPYKDDLIFLDEKDVLATIDEGDIL